MLNKEDVSLDFSGNREKSVLSLGYENFVVAQRIVAVLASTSLPAKRLRDQADKQNLLLDATAGRKTRSLVIVDSRHVILSALTPLKIQQRLNWTTPLEKENPRIERRELEWKEGEFAS